MRKQHHLWPSSEGVDAWEVGRLIALTQGLPVEEVAIASLGEIDSNYWFTPEVEPTVRRVVEHLRLIDEVDVSFPIILGPDGRVMDGMHRVARALRDGCETVRAVRFAVLPAPDFPNCRPQDLPYD